MSNRITALLYRVTCPSSEELGQYHFGILSQSQALVVARHLAECPHCVAEISGLKQYLLLIKSDLPTEPIKPDPVPLSEQIGQGLRILIANLVNPPQPSFVLLGDHNGPQIYEVDEVQVSIQIENEAERPNRKALFGLVMGIDPKELVAYLWRPDTIEEVATTKVNHLGQFIISELEPAMYDLILENSETEFEIHIQNLQI